MERPRIDIVRADQIEAVARLRAQPVKGRKHLLVRAASGVHDIGRFFEAFVMGRIPENCAGLFDERAYGFAGGGGPAAEDRPAVRPQDALRARGERSGVRRPVVQLRTDLAPQNAAAAVDLLDGEHFRVQERSFAGRQRPRE